MNLKINHSDCRIKISHLFVSIFLFVTAACSLYGQAANKKKISQNDYSLWNTLYNPIISNDGEWAAWKLNYKNIKDTLVIKNTHSNKMMMLENTLEYGFSPNGKWLYNYSSDNKITLIKLINGKTLSFPDVHTFHFTKKEDYLGILNGENKFLLIDLKNDNTTEIDGVSEFSFSPNGNWVAISVSEKEKNSTEIVSTISAKRYVLLSNDKSNFSNLVWNAQSSSLAFMEVLSEEKEKFTDTRLYEFRNGEIPKLSTLNPKYESQFPIDTYISAKDELFFAEDGNRIFFNIRPKSFLKRNLDSLNNNVQVWKGDDKWIVPRQLRNADEQFGPFLVQWNPENQELIQIANTSLPCAYLMPKENYAILFDPKQYEPEFKYEGDTDIYIMDLKSKEKKRILEKHPNGFYNKFGSPNGKFISYFRDENWWVYDIEKNLHTNISLNIPFELYTTENKSSNAPLAYGFAGWSSDDKWVFIYDQYDIWQIATNGRENHLITNGRGQQTTYRVYKKQFEEFPYQRFGKFKVELMDIDKDILLEASAPSSSGYYLWNIKNGIRPLFTRPTKIDNLKKAKISNTYIIQEEAYNIPKRLYVVKNNSESLLYESNTHYKNFVNARQELITYKSPDEKELKGILMYPDNYEEGKKYPMIVHIYERFSDRFQNYITPTLYNPDGFNPKVYTEQGYFVLYPDITYEVGNTGVSALKCVTTAVETVLKTGMVNKDRMGLQGHSFGGYEAAFIATQTNMFAAIVSSAGATDLISWYLTIGGNDGRPNMWWFEEHQWRMGSSFYDNPEAYYRNSPIHHAKNINTPILLWSGAEDVHVNVTQNIEFYLALRRLGKDVTFLYYPFENHGLLKPKNQQDLTIRISDWFNSYLKPK